MIEVKDKHSKTRWDRAVILEVKDGKYFIHLEGYKGDLYDEWVDAARIRPAEGVKYDEPTDEARNDNANDARPQNDNAAAKTPAAATTPGVFKPGDRVQVSQFMLGTEDSYIPCTVLEYRAEKTQYAVRCDPTGDPKTDLVGFTSFTIGKDYVRAWGAAKPAPKLDCPFNEPAGTISQNAKPSAALFQRLIFEDYKYITGLKIGMTFETFRLGTPYRNVITATGLMHGGAQPNQLVQPIRARFQLCKDRKDRISGELIEQDFICYKDEFGDWKCPNVTVAKITRLGYGSKE